MTWKHRISGIIVVGLVLACSGSLFHRDAGAADILDTQSIQTRFQEAYSAWSEKWIEPRSFHSDTAYYVRNPEFRALVALGVPALPYIVENMETGGLVGACMVRAMRTITHKRFTRDEKIAWRLQPYHDRWVHWWKEGRRQTPRGFEKLYSEWQDAKAQGKGRESAQKYQRILYLGVAALPYVLDKVEQGDADLVQIVSRLTSGAISTTASTAECLEWWKKNKQKWTLPPVESEESTN